MSFPQRLIDQVHVENFSADPNHPGSGLPVEALQKLINFHMSRILPFMGSELVSCFPYKADPFNNSLQKYLFYGFEH